MNNLAKKFHQDAAHMAENVALRNVIATGLGKYAEGRDKKIADFQDWQKARETASQMKRESLNNLPQNIQQLTEKLTSRGTHIHFAGFAASGIEDGNAVFGNGERPCRYKHILRQTLLQRI